MSAADLADLAPRARLRGIYALVEPERGALEPFVDALLQGGIRLFQVRAKAGIRRDRLLRIVERVHAHDGLTLINDDVDLALAADGVHLGQEDAALHDLRALRERLGNGIIGLSCGTPEEARAADPALIDYIGVGPIFATRSKADAGSPIGIEGVRRVVDSTELPAAAIGGIDRFTISSVRKSGAKMAAVIAALYAEDDASATARALVAAWGT